MEQGELGDPWLLSAVSSLTLTPRFLDRVVPPDQSFEHGYCGVFRFRFWHFGDWVEVLEDVAELEEVRCWTLTLPVTSTLFLAGLNFLLSGQVL